MIFLIHSEHVAESREAVKNFNGPIFNWNDVADQETLKTIHPLAYPTSFPAYVVEIPEWYESPSDETPGQIHEAKVEVVNSPTDISEVYALENSANQRAIDNPVPEFFDEHFDPPIGAPDV